MLCLIARPSSFNRLLSRFAVLKRFNSDRSMDEMHFRRLEGSESFQVQFQFNFQPLNVARQFNFSRNLSESLDTFVDRIRANLDKVLSKRKARRQKKTDSPELDEACASLHIELWDTQQGCSVSRTEKCEDVFFTGDTSCLVFHISDTIYRVIVNSPWVKSVHLPSSIMAGFPVYPNKIELLFATAKTSKYFWYVATQEKFKRDEWTEVGQEMIYIPSESDVGCKIKFKCVPSDGVRDGAETEVVTFTEVQSGPGPCPFEERHAYTSERLDSGSFRIVTYNILANLYAETDVAKKELFPNCPQHALSLDYRKQLYLKELLGYNADVICLQEVDQKVFTYDLQCVFINQDLEGIFSVKGGTVNEGLTTFFSREKFRLKDSHRIVLAEEVDTNPIFYDIWKAINENEILKQKFKDRATVAQVVVLESLTRSGEILVVGNTHLYFSPYAEHIRLLQGGMFIAYVGYIAETIAKSNPEHRVSIVLCGDFNSSPDCGIYTLLTTGHVPDDVTDWKCGKNEIVKDLTLRQPYSFSSAYGTPEYTNFTVNFAGCLDYIYFQNDRLSLKQIVPLPSDEDVKRYVALPNVVFPSDHLALIADFGWK